MSQCDVAIIGGGLVGAAMARALASSNINTVLIDNQPETSLYSAALDNRGIALSYTSATILKNLNVWDKLIASAHAIKSVHVSEQGAFGYTKICADKYNLPALGYVVSASDLGAALIRNLDDLAVSVMRPVDIKGLCYDSQTAQWDICLDACKLRAKLLIAADGSNSALRDKMNISITSKDYQQTAIVCNVILQQNNTATAFERFTSNGVLALLPFGVKQLKCVWTVANSRLEEFLRISDLEYLDQIQSAIGYRVGKICGISRRITFPIQQLQANSLYASGVVLLGNAANTMHPVAAQGFNLGLRDVAALAAIVKRASLNNVPLNASEILQQYAMSREIDHSDTQKYTNSLVEIFSSDQAIIKRARRFGLLAAQFIPSLNKKVMSQGLGTWMS